ncbi:MAG: T9SS type A sorting domain-containing protein [Bacteroidales bacterium]|nr:T9SS type A sorting domain-containing protein [Bacteroidales bacterium]
MLKKSLLILALTSMVSMISAQSLQFENNGVAFANNEVYICDQTPNEFGEMTAELQIRNLTANDMDVVVEKEYVQIVEGTSNYFCWGLCNDASVMIGRPYGIAANAVSGPGEFSIHYQVDPTYSGDEENYLAGTSVVKFYAYPVDNPDDRTCLNVWFAWNATDVVENTISFGQAYPNPASNLVQFDLRSSGNTNVKAVVYNLLGQEVKSVVANSGQGSIKIDASDMQSGIYFCSFFVNDEVLKTEKFIIKK